MKRDSMSGLKGMALWRKVGAPVPAIVSFRGEHHFLSNFYPAKVSYEDDVYASVEHAYQAAKTEDREWREVIQRETTTASEAKRIGGHVLKRPEGWDTRRLFIMLSLLYQKFGQDTALCKMLLATDNAKLIEGNTWGDTFWGMVKGRTAAWEGENHLGKLLMRVRNARRRRTSHKGEA